MKLFIKLFGIPETRKPDYDFITRVEREYQMDDEGFNERYDEMLIRNFKNEWSENSWDDSPDDLMEKLENFWAELTSNKFRETIDKVIDEVYRERYPDDEEFRRDCENLRSRMIIRGKYALDN